MRNSTEQQLMTSRVHALCSVLFLQGSVPETVTSARMCESDVIATGPVRWLVPANPEEDEVKMEVLSAMTACHWRVSF